jgi:hypothetical protein
VAVYLFLFLGKRRYTLDQIEREEFTEETESERPESEPEVSLSQRYIEITHDPPSLLSVAQGIF